MAQGAAGAPRDGAREPAPRLFEMLSDTEGADDHELPDTGVGIALERVLAAPLITGVTYGTRASTVLEVAADDIAGAVRLAWDSALVLTGATRRDEVDESPWRPTVVLDDLSGLV